MVVPPVLMSVKEEGRFVSTVGQELSYSVVSTFTGAECKI